ncbi:DEAD/DEAH box helicase [Haladaptatus sp. NG-WS-4]
MEYIPATSVTESDSGGEAELEVWERLKQVFDRNERGVLYHQYPIIEKGGNRFDRKPDFVLLHEELGLLIIECKGYLIDHIASIEGETWYLQNINQKRAAPLEQARDQGFHLTSFFQRESILRNDRGQVKIPMNVFVALPNISRDEWERRGFSGPSEPRVILSDDMTPVALRTQLENVLTFDPLSNEEYEAARDVLSCGQPISGKHGSPPASPTTRTEHYETVAKGLEGLDVTQQEIGMRIPNGPQQIREIAGSGKSVLVAMKAARMLSEDNDWRIALTFSTKSLYDHITSLVERYYEHFTSESFDNVADDIDIIHGWGGNKTGAGVYKRVADATLEVEALDVGEARDRFGWNTDLQEAVATEVLETGNVPTMWDAILIDEAQDFGPQFFNLCLEALDENDRLIWAYDEAQDLGSLTAPSPTNIFGTDEDGTPRVDMSGSYEDGIQKSHIMRKAYRAPREVLMTAHALGMGLKREEGPLQAITRQDGWDNLGYEVDGDFRKTGSQATLTRPLANSPHPLQDYPNAAPFVQSERFDRKSNEIEWVAEQIADDVHEHGLNPEQVLVVLRGKKAKGHGHYMLREELQAHGIDLNCVWNDDNKEFARPGKVTASRIQRAKGNEAASVYVVGLEAVVDESYKGDPVRRRNEAFIAASRSRAWCTITGIEEGAEILDELERVLGDVRKATPSITFEVPDTRNLDNELETDTENLKDTHLADFV